MPRQPRALLGLGLALALAACQAPVVPRLLPAGLAGGGGGAPASEPATSVSAGDRALLALAPASANGLHGLSPVAVSASSTLAGTTPAMAVDASPTTAWSSNGVDPSKGEWLMLRFDRAYGFDSLRLKSNALPEGCTYSVEVSDDGLHWTDAGGPYGHPSAGYETRPLVGQGRFLRLHGVNGFGGVARFSIADVQVSGKANPAFTTIALPLNPNKNFEVFHGALSIGGFLTVNSVTGTAFDSVPKGRKFQAMLGVDFGTFGHKYIHLTPANAGFWGGDHGGTAGVAFLDSVGGTGDNAGGWSFSLVDPNRTTSQAFVSAKTGVTLWDPARALAINLGARTRKWNVHTLYNDPSFPFNGSPGVVLVYSHPDGSRDFTVPEFAYGGSGLVSTIETQGYVYAFFMAADRQFTAPSGAVLQLKAMN